MDRGAIHESAGPFRAPVKAVVLAAGRGKRFGAKTKVLPKCLVPLGSSGVNLLQRYLETFRQTGLKNVTIVVGHLKNKIIRECRKSGRGLRIRFVENRRYRRGSILSLRSASKDLQAGAIIMDADVFFPAAALKRLLKAKKSAFLFDPRSKSAGEEMMIMAKTARPWMVSKKINPNLKILGEATGIFRLDAKDGLLLKRILDDFFSRGIFDVEYEEAYSQLCQKRIVGTTAIGNVFWSEMDFKEDWDRISARVTGKKP